MEPGTEVMMIRHAVRTLSKNRGATTVVVLTIAVAIAATTVIYSVVDLVWGFIPVVKRDGLVYVASTDRRVVQAQGTTESVVLRSRVSMPDLADWSARSTTFAELAGFEMSSVTLTGVDVPVRLSSVRVTPNLVDSWGFTPVLGRPFQPDDGRAGATPVTLLTFGFWQRQFSSDASAIGRSVLLDGVAHTIVGVLPPEAGTGVLRDSDLFLPLVLDPLRGERGQRGFLVTGRLKPGVTRAQANTEIEAIARQLRDEHPDTNQGIGASVLPLIEATGFNVRVLLVILGLVALLVLVVACANVSGILVAQSLVRRHELAVRAALGAGRSDRVRQLMTESVLASALACIVGLMFAAWGISALRWLGGGDSFALADIRMNWRALIAGVATALVAPFGFGMLPALRTATPDPQELKDGARGAGVARRGRRARSLIVALQAGAAMILMVQIGLLVRTTWALSDIAPGFDPTQVLTFRVGLSDSRYEGSAAIERFTTELLSRLRTLPGVASAGVSDRLPVADREPLARLIVEGTAPVPLDKRPTIARAAIAGDYLATMRIPVKRGRVFSAAEMSGASPVALLNEEAARRFWPGSDPLNRSDSRGPTPTRIALDTTPGQEVWLEVVGVVGNLRNSDIDQGPLPQVFVPMSQRPSRELAVVVKSVTPSALQLVPAIRAEVTRIDRDQPIHDVALMTQVLFDDMAGTYVLTALLTAIGLIALGLSAAGVYGLVSSSVAQRSREIGVRMALGARPGAVVRLMIASGARPVAGGSLVGLVAAVALAAGIGLSVPGVDARDPSNYAAVTLTLAIVALLASYLPARRAATIDPVAALRQ
jgi:putative ABC transport system permease protein